MAEPSRVDERISLLEARMSEFQQLPGRIDRLESRIDRLESDLRAEIRAVDSSLREEMRTGHVMIVTALTEQVEESRRYTRILHEDVLDRIGVMAEGLAANTGRTDALSGRVDTLSGRVDKLAGTVDGLAGTVDALAEKIDVAHAEDQAMFTLLLSRIDAPKTAAKRKRR